MKTAKALAISSPKRTAVVYAYKKSLESPQDGLNMVGMNATSLLAATPRWVVLIGVWAVVLGGFLFVSWRILSALLPSSSIALTFSSESKDDIANSVLARAKELMRPIRLDALTEVYTPQLAVGLTSHDGGIDDALGKVEVKGMDVSGIMKAVYSLSQPKMQQVRGTTSVDGTIQLVWSDFEGKPVRSWTVSRQLVNSDKEAPDAKWHTIDRAIYQILYYANYDVQSPSQRKQEMDSVYFPSPAAFEAYELGQQYLKAYQSGFNPTLLDQAEDRLKYLRGEMPGFVDGLMLLGVTLSEQRKEDEAITVFDQVLSIRKAAISADKLRGYNAQLLRATAFRKLYRVEENHRAVEALRTLLSNVEEDLASVDPAAARKSDKNELFRLKLSVKCELVSALGHYMVLLTSMNFDDALAAEAPEQIRMTKEETVSIGRQPIDTKNRCQIFKSVRERLFNLQAKTAEETRKDLEEYKQLGGSDGKDYSVFKSKLDNACGYSKFRYVQEVTEPERFHKEMADALQLLRKANAAQPNDYMVLQNLATLLLDRRFDPAGRNIAESAELLRRSLKIKPRDYWGYEQLALTTLRKESVFGAGSVAALELDEAIVAAEKARELRPTGCSSLPILAELYILKWEQDAAKRAELEASIETIVGVLRVRNPSSYASALVEARLGMAQARKATNTSEFDAAVGRAFRAVKEVGFAIEKIPPTMEIASVKSDLSRVEHLLAKKRFNERKELFWPSQDGPKNGTTSE